MSSHSILNRIGESIHINDPNADAYLFGSRARGDNRPNSDWDILILVEGNKVTNETEDLFRNEIYDIELESGQTISTFIYPKEFWNNILKYSPLYINIQKEGIRI